MKFTATFSYSLLLLCLCMAMLQGVNAQPIQPRSFAEYAPTQGIFVEWDFNNDTWDLYSQLIDELEDATTVYSIVINQGEENDMRQRLTNDGVPLNNVVFIQTPAVRMWIRDHGPFAIADDGALAFLDLNDLANSGVDENLPTRLAQEWGINSYNLPWTLCGGNFMVDSHGTLFCTERLFSNNPNTSPAQIRSDLRNYFGIEHIELFRTQHNDYWGHIDMQMKLLNDSTIVLSSTTQPGQPNYDSLEANYQKLLTLTSPSGSPYHIVRLPHALNWKTYANSIIVNQKVIVPIYSNPLDSVVLSMYQTLLPGYTVVGINSNAIIGWEGALHCITMQVPDLQALLGIPNSPLFDEVNFQLYPNPVTATGNIDVQFTLQKSQRLTIELITLNGQVLQSQTAIYSAGENTLKLSLTSVSEGIYQVLFRGEKATTVRSLLVIP